MKVRQECPSCLDSTERVAALKELLVQRIKHLEDLSDERRITTADELKLQATETQRRLHELNGEAGRLRMIQDTYLPREIFHSELNKVNAAVEDLKAWKNTALGRQSVVTIVISVIFGLAGFMLNYFLSGHVKAVGP